VVERRRKILAGGGAGKNRGDGARFPFTARNPA